MEQNYAQQENLEQDAFDRMLEKQTPESLDKLMDGLVRLVRLKEQSGELSSGHIEMQSPPEELPAK